MAESATPSPAKSPPRLRLQLALFTLMRVVINTAYRMVYPLAPAFMDGLGITFARYSLALQLRHWSGAFGPLLGLAADRYGRKRGMLFGALLYLTGLVVIVLLPTFPGFLLSGVLIVLGKYTFDPAMQAYLGDRVAYERRGLVIAIAEFGWSGATLLGIPLAGLLIAREGWLAPFPLLIALTAALTIAIALTIPRDPGEAPTGNPFRRFGEVFTSRSALSALAVTLAMMCGNEMINLIFGVWLEDRFGLAIAALGASAIVLGGAELLGEGLVGVITDRMGKRRAVITGTLLNSLAALLLPVISGSQVGAFVGLFFFYLTFEFTLVSTIPMMTEVLPSARATLLAFNTAASSIGRALAALIIPTVYAAWGFNAGALLTVVANALVLLALRGVVLPED